MLPQAIPRTLSIFSEDDNIFKNKNVVYLALDAVELKMFAIDANNIGKTRLDKNRAVLIFERSCRCRLAPLFRS